MKKHLLLIYSVIFNLFLFPVTFSFGQKNNSIEVKPEYSAKVLTEEKKSSIITVPFDISIEDIQKQINAGLPDPLFVDDSFEDNNNDELKIKVWRKGKFEFTSSINDQFSYEVPLKIWVQKRISAFGMSQAPSTNFEIKLKFTSKFYLGSDYVLHTTTTSNGFEWITKPSLKAGYVEIPIGPIVGKIIENNQAMFARQIDETIQATSTIKPYILDSWNTAYKPVLVSEEYKTWVILTPQDVFLTPLKSNGYSLKSTIGLKVLVESYVGELEITDKFLPKALPNLKLVNYIPDNFEISLFNFISYAEATKISKNMFLGQVYEFKNGKYKIEITDLEIYGNADNLIFKIETKGNFKGTIYLRGIPVYNKELHQVVLSKTELDIKTKNFLHRAGAWLLEGTLERKIEKDFGMPVDEIINFAKESVNTTINSEFSKGVKMKGEIIEVEPKDVKVSENGILAIVNAKAKVQLIVKGL